MILLPILFGVLIAILVMLIFFGLWRWLKPFDELEQRMDAYEEAYGEFYIPPDVAAPNPKPGLFILAIMRQLFTKGAMGQRLMHLLSQANWSIAPFEFALIMMSGAIIGFGIGVFMNQFVLAPALAFLFLLLPYMYLKRSAKKRKQAIAGQTAELLKFLTGALRAGFGLNQALESVADQLPSPMKEEIQRVNQSVHLGLSLPEALSLMAHRVESDEFDMLVVAITVQYETGGNLAPILESIGQTIQDRLQIKREIRVLTAQQRMSGYILTLLPIALAVFMYLSNPDYMMRLFAPGWIRILPVAATLMMIAGFFVIRKIIEIEV